MINRRTFDVTTDGLLTLSLREDRRRPWWWYLDLEGQPLYLLGNNCGTCSAIFRRVQNVKLPLTPRQLSVQLAAGLEVVPQAVVDTVRALLPKGRYSVELSTITPMFMTRQNQPAEISCAADYFWLGHFDKNAQGVEYEIVLPIVPHSELSPDTIAFYQAEFENGRNPTALALSLHDHRVVNGRYHQEALAHFLLDGHHKLMAASKLSRPISILSFLRLTTYAETAKL